MSLFTNDNQPVDTIPVDSGEEIPRPEDALVYNTNTASVYENIDSPVNVSATLDGSPWETEAYYNQHLGEDDFPRQLDIGIHPSVQSYVKINSLVIYSTDPLTPSRDETTGVTRLEGSGNMYPSVVPIVGDMFPARMIDGRLGLFVITASEPLNITNGSAHTVSYRLFDYHNPEFQENLTRKTVRELTYNDNGCCEGELIEGTIVPEVTSTLAKLVTMYYDLFYDRETQSMAYPSEDVQKDYDPFVTEFFKRIVDYELRGRNPPITIYSCTTEEHRDKFTTIWDCMLWGDIFSFHLISKQSRLVNTFAFTADRLFEAIGDSHFNRVIWPQSRTTLFETEVPDVIDPEVYYVFSKEFYMDDRVNMSPLENSVRNALVGVKPTAEDLNTYVGMVSTLTKQKLFYFIPVLIYLFKIYMR